MSFKRLKEGTGNVLISAEAPLGDSVDRIVRRAICVHAGPDGKEMVFVTGDGSEIKFDGARVQRIVDNHNKKLEKLLAEYGGLDKTPDGAYNPILDSHVSENNDDVIGRFTGRLSYEVRDVPKVGKNVPCAVSEGLTFLGKDTVERVNDGRIYHLSIGVSDETDELGEISTVIEPAAPGAMLLKHGKGSTKSLNKGDSKMAKNIKLQAAAASKKRLKGLTGFKAQLTQMSATLKGASDQVKLTAKKGDITHRLTKLMRSGKMTPAENKKLDLTKLSKLPAEAFEIMMGAFDAREPQIMAGQRGTTDAQTFSDIGKSLEKKQLKRLRAEALSDFTKMTGRKLKLKSGEEVDPAKKMAGEEEDEKDMGGGNHEEEITTPNDPHAVDGEEKHLEYMQHMSAMEEHLAAGDIDAAKECHAKMKAHLEKFGMKKMSEGGPGDVKSEDYKESMDALQGQVDELQTNLARMAGAVDELMSVEKEEGHDLEAGDEEEEKELPAKAPVAGEEKK